MQKGFSGIELIVVVIVLAAVTGGAATAVHTYTSSIKRAETAEANEKVEREARVEQQVENKGLQVKAEMLDKQIAERATTDQKLAALERKVTNAFSTLYATSPEARKWASTPIPADVLAIVRNRRTGGAGDQQIGAGAAALPVVRPDGSPRLLRLDGTERRAPVVRPATGVKPR